MTLADDRPIELDVRIVQQTTDDLVALGIRAFAERYGNVALVKMYDGAAGAPSTNNGARG